MSVNEWSRIITKIAPFSADSIDDLLATHDPRASDKGDCIFPAAKLQSSPKMTNPAQVCIGVRVKNEIYGGAMAMKLARMALEKDVFPVIFSYGDYAGLERFGFRVEKISGASKSEREACEAQLKKFWGITLVI